MNSSDRDREAAHSPSHLDRRIHRWISKSWWIWLGIFTPAGWPALRIVRQDPRVMADPIEYLLNYSGMVALVLLALTLSLTPLRVLIQASWPKGLNRHRRLIGVSAWGWGTVHLAVYYLYIGGLPGILDNIDRLFILAGLIAWTILCVLAVTSFRRMVRWIGGRRWKWLHRMVYLAGGLALYHYAIQEKSGAQLAYWFIIPLVLLQTVRIIYPRLRNRN